MTVNDAKLMDELDDEEAETGTLILLDINLKNTSEWPFEMKDMLESTEVTGYIDESGFSNGAEFFESVNEMEGVLEPGEDQDGQFITDVEESDEYYFMQENGTIAAGTSNQVIWTIPVDEIDKE